MKAVVFALPVLMLFVVAPKAHGQVPIDYPVGGMLYHQSEPSAVWFACSRLAENRISCTFTQFKAYTAGYPSVEQRLPGVSPPNEEWCASARAELAQLLGNGIAGNSNRTQEEAEHIERLEATVKYCETGNREAFRALVTREHERQQKACTVSAHFYTQTFRRASFEPRKWVTETPPYGDCMQHPVAEFYEERDQLLYTAAYKVLNKSARSGVIGCHEMREQEAIFGPGPSNEAASRMACETINFAPGCYSPNFPCLGPTAHHRSVTRRSEARPT